MTSILDRISLERGFVDVGTMELVSRLFGKSVTEELIRKLAAPRGSAAAQSAQTLSRAWVRVGLGGKFVAHSAAPRGLFCAHSDASAAAICSLSGSWSAATNSEAEAGSFSKSLVRNSRVRSRCPSLSGNFSRSAAIAAMLD